MKPVRTELAHRANYGVRRGKIEWIVMHYTANDGDSGMSNARYFQKALNPVASAHYFVDDREIVQSVPDEYVAYHCGAYKYRHPFCRNYNSIGIEMCDSKRDGTVKATEQTIRNAAELAAALCERYGLPVSHIIRHYDVMGKKCPAYWVGNDGLEKFRKQVEEVGEVVEKSYMVVDGKKVRVCAKCGAVLDKAYSKKAAKAAAAAESEAPKKRTRKRAQKAAEAPETTENK